MRTQMLLTIAGLAMVFACLALIGLVGTAAQDVAQRAVSAADTPDTAQRVTAVCVGLNLGSCRTTQESTSKRATGIAGDGNPWPMIALATAVIAPLVLWGAFYFSKPRGWED